MKFVRELITKLTDDFLSWREDKKYRSSPLSHNGSVKKTQISPQ